MAASADHAAVVGYHAHFSRPAAAVIADLESYARLLEKWQRVQNLVSRETLTVLWSRHFSDSLQLLRFVRPADRRFLDLGSGGGFPALPLAIATKSGEKHFKLVEPTARKVSFLRTVARELDLPVTVIGRRAEQVDSRETGPVDVITARALADLPVLCRLAAPFFSAETRLLVHKGREYREELARLTGLWHCTVNVAPSDIEGGGVVVEISDLRLKSDD